MMHANTKSTNLTQPGEPTLLWLMKIVAHLGAVFLYLVFFTSPWALSGALIASSIALLMAQKLKMKFTILGLFSLSSIGIMIAYLLSSTIEGVQWFSHILGANIALRTSDTLFFIFLFFFVSGSLRLWSKQSRMGSLFEGIFVLLSVIQLFAAHRGGQIHEPRFFTDWVLIGGHAQVTWWLQIFGLSITGLFLLSMTKIRQNLHFLMAVLCLFALITLIAKYTPKQAVEVVEPLTLGGGKGNQDQQNDQQQDSSNGDSGESGQSNSSQSPQRPPVPVAVAIFHDDYLPENGVYYFRQQVLSRFDGVKLVSDDSGQFDQDVITDFPYEQSLQADQTQIESAHILLPTSMLLLNEHPTPPMLTHGVQVKPMENPNPQRFVSAYDVISRIPSVPLKRHLGKASIPSSWDDKKRAHYLATHEQDPRYQSLAQEITSELSSAYMADPLRKAIAIKRYLEQAGHYSLKAKHRSRKDPAASFLFGSLKGYCVHFAHSAVHLLRSQGIAARVALGYAVDARTRSNSSAVVITGDRAHAWPEIHVSGVGWVTFDIYPEHSDEPAPQMVSQSMESLFGEIARDQTQRGLKPAWEIPWTQILHYISYILVFILLCAYLFNFYRYLRLWFASDEQMGKWGYLIILDRLAGSGMRRRYGESREAFALRVSKQCPSLPHLTEVHLAWAWSKNDEALLYTVKQLQTLEGPAESILSSQEYLRYLSKKVRSEYAKNHRIRWFFSHLNPLSSYLSR